MKDLLSSLVTAALLLSAVALPFLAFTWLGGVSFGLRLGFSLAGLAGPLLLLYVLRPRRPRRTVASLLFWDAVSLAQQANTPFQRLRRNLVLLLQLLALAALAYGLARPVVQSGASEGRSLVLILDTSASMLAVDHEGRARFEAARETALELVAGLRPSDQATVIAANRTAYTVVPWSSDAGALERGLRGLSARHLGTALADAFILAAGSAAAASGERLEVHLLSDGGGPTPPPVNLRGELIYHAFGGEGDNLGIVSVDVRPRVARGGELAGEAGELAWEVFASVHNAGQEAREVFVALEPADAAGGTIAARRLSVPAGASRAAVLEARLSPGPAVVRLLPTEPSDTGRLDALDADDSAYVLIPEERGVAVGLVTTEASPALERSLRSAGANLRLIAPDAFQDDPQLRLYVFEGWVPETLPPRDCLILSPAGVVGPLTPGPVIEDPRIAGWDREDPLLRFVNLGDVEVGEARPFALGGGARVLVAGEDPASGEGVVLVASWREGGARRVAVGFDIYRSSWPLRVSFPIFVRNCLLHASRRDHLAQGGVQAGTPLAIPVQTDVSSAEVERPDGRRVQVPAWGGRAYFAATHQTGVYSVRAGGREERFCVNLGDPAESQIAPRPTFSLGGREATGEVETRRPVEVAALFALLALLVLTLEAWAYHRRW